MIHFHHKVYAAKLKDLGYSGSMKNDEIIAYFSEVEQAKNIAIEKAGERDVTGKQGFVEEIILDIKIYESKLEYENDNNEKLVNSARIKLTDKEYTALYNEIMKKGV